MNYESLRGFRYLMLRYITMFDKTSPALIWLVCVAPAMAQVQAVRMVPAQRATAASTTAQATQVRTTTSVAAKSGKPELGADEKALVKADYDRLSAEDQAAMVAAYKDLGIDLLAALGLAAPAATPADNVLAAIRTLDFSRTPDKVLEARAQLGLQSAAMPADDIPIADQASWVHRNVLAGEWQALRDFLQQRAGGDAQEIYAHVLQSTNQGDPGLLPEDILAISEACPAELTEWQLTLLAQLLKTASSRSSTGPFLAELRKGTTFFGPQEDGRRARTATFLSEAGLAVEAYDFLPVLATAREKFDADALAAHARYHEARAAALGNAPQAQQHVRTAWELYGEIALMDRTDFESRRAAMGQAIELLPNIPPAPATEWLQKVFANESLAATGLEAVALKAMRIGNEKIDIQERASAILMMKESVDALLNDERIELSQLRVPLRLLTMSLVAAAEETINKQASKPGVANETTLLLRALPGDKWQSLIEASLAVRAYKAFVGTALAADNTDMALAYLERGIERAPGQSIEMADEFLRVWMLRLNPPPDPRMMQNYIILNGRMQQASAPLTRGRQERNLERLKQLLGLLDSIDVNGRTLERVVTAFAACHGKAETYRRDNVVAVLGEIEQLNASVSAQLAESMRSGLNGDWRSRDVQQAEGNKRSESEIQILIEEGYQLALELIDSAVAQEPSEWRYAMTKAALAYDHMQFRKKKEQDAASYNVARQELFRSFGNAARQYQAAVLRGELREDPGVYVTWFSIALGSSDLSGLKAEDLMTEGEENNDQIQLIREQILEMPSEMAASHLGEFARRVIDQLPTMTPEVKPGVVRRANDIVGDHPAGALLRQTMDLYNDLLRSEMQLHLSIDGVDQVGTEPFGVVMSLRYTAAIGRELGGFNQYLQNNVYSYVSGQYRPINFLDRLEKSINQAFNDKFELVHVGFFDSMNPSRSIQVDGQAGWEEKPLCYMIVRATDPSIDRLPQLQMDINTMDTTGLVVLPVLSNSVSLDASASNQPQEQAAARPVYELDVVQTFDTRDLQLGEAADIIVEVSATGRGMVPELSQLLEGLGEAVEGYQLKADAIESEPIQVLGVAASSDRYMFYGNENSDSETYVEADEDGLFRLPTMRKWKVVLEPSAITRGDEIRVPRLAAGLSGRLLTERYDDMDLVSVDGETAPLLAQKTDLRWWFIGSGVGLVLLVGMVWLLLRSRGQGDAAQDDSLRLPESITPFSAVMTLRRFALAHVDRLNADELKRLNGEIAELERHYFAPTNGKAVTSPDSLQAAGEKLAHWQRRLTRV